MSPIELPWFESVRPTRSLASLLCPVVLVIGSFVGVVPLIRPQAAWALLPMVVAVRRHVVLKAVALPAAAMLLPLVAAVTLWPADTLFPEPPHSPYTAVSAGFLRHHRLGLCAA